ncbi:MAG: hypothetical protein COV67_00345 [Nitrospinae bacterium CG11_big_fil_rev_8_21_14_0_20_56_8]|nr:MAG: hypothetical protein COV67_00345 [Nitrospinae bacterium CG11_big_fil_rev_8_21_14_0_20_56_8]
MELTITGVDYAPDDLCDQIPLAVKRVREIPGADRTDRGLGELHTPVRWRDEDREKTITRLLLAASGESRLPEAGKPRSP